MTDHPDCDHDLAICPTCQGLAVTRLDRITGVTSISIDTSDGPITVTDGALYIGPVTQPCEPAGDQGPSVGEAAADDRRWALEREGE